MDKRQKNLKLPTITSAGSFLVLALLLLLTNPIERVGFAIIFFAALLTFLISLGLLIVNLQFGGVSRKNRFRVITVSVFLLVVVMFRSAQSLGLIDALILILITIGLLFYGSRRV